MEMNLVPEVGRQIHLQKIPKELLLKVLRSPRSAQAAGRVCACARMYARVRVLCAHGMHVCACVRACGRLGEQG